MFAIKKKINTLNKKFLVLKSGVLLSSKIYLNTMVRDRMIVAS